MILDKEYVLKRLPEGYTLWVHSAPDGGSGPQKKKMRTDAYLYGHPLGQTKRFRSAEEFKPHLIWLATDDSGESKDCTCKVCKKKDAPMSKLTDVEGLLPSCIQYRGILMLHLKHQHRNLYQPRRGLIPRQLVNNSSTVIPALRTSIAQESWYGLIKAQPGAWPLYASDR
jgi:hypothetical protein